MKRNWLLLFAVGLLLSAGAVGQETEEKTEAATDSATESDESAKADDSASEQPLIWVFRHRRVKQCDDTEMSLEESRIKLKDAGVAVHQSSCGFRTDTVFVSGCGEPTGQILLHLIRGNALDAVIDEGYGPAEQVKYQVVTCPKMEK
ncbi:hypothetical protein [uncultured Microbulbifer sp.]|uniref:hypothetical protein n=1 Tax=uncultured Microbulbifer sp. TaxID=348147 RepID=UPI0025FDE85C|nr:hypothetical protein [uncultured Microbulbifer sp.]